VPESRRRQLAVPAYFHPHDHAADWARLASTDVGLVVANISNGPGIVREEQWARAFSSVRASGCDVVGYVDAGYLGLTGLRTQRGSTLLDDWLEQILRDVSAWYRRYGDQVTGIFLDQAAESDDGASLAPVFRRLRDDIRRLDGDAVMVLNPGEAVPCAFADIADVIVTFEGSYEDYLASGTETAFEPLSWEPAPGQAIWHMIHHTPDAACAAEVIALSRERGANLVYVTDHGGENPYRSLPSSEIWSPPKTTSDTGVVRRLPACGWRRPRRLRRRAAASTTNAPADLHPDSTLINNPMLSRWQNVIEASADFVVASSAPRVFLASGRHQVPHWWTGSTPQIAADWMIEGTRLYAYAGTGTDWEWTPAGEVPFQALGQQVRWEVAADRIGLDRDTDATAAFHVSAPGLREYSSVATECVRPTEQAAH
jgi:Spherulation-specific family 4